MAKKMLVVMLVCCFCFSLTGCTTFKDKVMGVDRWVREHMW